MGAAFLSGGEPRQMRFAAGACQPDTDSVIPYGAVPAVA